MGKRLFATEKQATAYFAATAYNGKDSTEQCDHCGYWSVSQADHEEGAITGPWLNDDGEEVLDRACDKCGEAV